MITPEVELPGGRERIHGSACVPREVRRKTSFSHEFGLVAIFLLPSSSNLLQAESVAKSQKNWS
jgi:hypothetical protein